MSIFYYLWILLMSFNELSASYSYGEIAGKMMTSLFFLKSESNCTESATCVLLRGTTWCADPPYTFAFLCYLNFCFRLGLPVSASGSSRDGLNWMFSPPCSIVSSISCIFIITLSCGYGADSYCALLSALKLLCLFSDWSAEVMLAIENFLLFLLT